MTLDEAIIHSIDVSNSGCGKCSDEHRQLSEWLIELKDMRDWLRIDGKESNHE